MPLAQLDGLAELVLGQGAVVGVEELGEASLAELVDRLAEERLDGLGRVQPAQGLRLEPAEHLVGRDIGLAEREHRAAEGIVVVGGGGLRRLRPEAEEPGRGPG